MDEIEGDMRIVKQETDGVDHDCTRHQIGRKPGHPAGHRGPQRVTDKDRRCMTGQHRSDALDGLHRARHLVHQTHGHIGQLDQEHRSILGLQEQPVDELGIAQEPGSDAVDKDQWPCLSGAMTRPVGDVLRGLVTGKQQAVQSVSLGGMECESPEVLEKEEVEEQGDEVDRDIHQQRTMDGLDGIQVQSNASQPRIESGQDGQVEFRFGRGQHPFDFIPPLWVLLNNVQMLMPKGPSEPRVSDQSPASVVIDGLTTRPGCLV